MSAKISLGLASPSPAAVDPVCGMSVDPATAPAHLAHDGKTYYFCAISCAASLRQIQGNIWTAQRKSGGLRPSARHIRPSARRIRPGRRRGFATFARWIRRLCRIIRALCPKCGMALEPETQAGVEENNPELADMSRRFWIGLTLSVPIFVLALGDMLPGRPLHLVSMQLGNCLQLLFALPVVWWCGWPFFQRAWISLTARSPNMFTLIALGVGRGFFLQRGGHACSGLFSRCWNAWRRACLFRDGRGGDTSGSTRPDAGNPSAQPNQGGYSQAPGLGSQNRPRRPRRSRGRRSALAAAPR